MAVEIELMRKFLIAYQRPHVRLFRRDVVNVTLRELHTDKVRQVRAGLVGQSDLYGFVQVGRDVHDGWGDVVKEKNTFPIEIELKAWNGRLAKEQIAWQTFCQSFGITHLVLQAVKTDTPEQTVAKWCETLDRTINSL